MANLNLSLVERVFCTCEEIALIIDTIEVFYKTDLIQTRVNKFYDTIRARIRRSSLYRVLKISNAITRKHSYSASLAKISGQILYLLMRMLYQKTVRKCLRLQNSDSATVSFTFSIWC